MPSEFDLISRYFVRPTPQAALGPGDDCALLMPSPGMELAITTDNSSPEYIFLLIPILPNWVGRRWR